MKYCTSCGSRIPDNQGSNSCSMCYGDIDHGKDGYYRREVEDYYRRQEEQRQEEALREENDL